MLQLKVHNKPKTQINLPLQMTGAISLPEHVAVT